MVIIANEKFKSAETFHRKNFTLNVLVMGDTESCKWNTQNETLVKFKKKFMVKRATTEGMDTPEVSVMIASLQTNPDMSALSVIYKFRNSRSSSVHLQPINSKGRY